MVNGDELKHIMPRLPTARRAAYLPFLTAAMTEFEVTTYLREAAFLAQVAHESGELRFMEEIWGPTPAQLRYEGRRDLGNTWPGDGKRFKGRGPIQITGRANYRKYGDQLGVDLISDPKRAATREVGFRIAGLYWQSHGLNSLADSEDFTTITRRINGGLGGLADREMYYRRARLVLPRDGSDAGPGTSTPVRIVVNGREVLRAGGILRGDHVLVALRPVAAAAGWMIVDASHGTATLQDAHGVKHQVPLVIEAGVGRVALHDLHGKTEWDEAAQTATLSSD